MKNKEATARIKINKLLEAAGWRFFPEGSAPANIRLEPSVTIKSADLDALGENFEKTTKGFIDFLLLDTKSFPLIVLEAKSEDKNPLIGKEQARKYARSQNCRFVILSNGNLHYFWHLERGNPHVITSFPTPDSVMGYQKVINGARAVLYNYRPHIPIHPDWPMVELGEFCQIKGGYAFQSSDFTEKGVQLIRMGNVKRMLFDHRNSAGFLPNSFKNDYQSYILKKGDILISMTGTIGKEDYGNVCRIDIEGDFLLNQRVGKFEIDTLELNPSFLYCVAQSAQFRSSLFSNSSGGVRQANISNKGIEKVKIPLPSLATQQAIVAELEAEQALVAGNRELIVRFEKKIQASLARVWGEEL